MSDTPDQRPVALITGSGKRRVGNVIARELADTHRIAVHYFTSEDEANGTVAELRQAGTDAACFRADLRDERQVGQLVTAVRDRFGRLDVCVSAAATWGKEPFESTTADFVRKEWEANTLASFLLGQQAGLAMRDQDGGGTVVLIGDWATARPYPDHAAYFASKGAIPTLTRTLAVELAAWNPALRVNAILPGPVMLPESVGEEERQAVIQATLVKREGRPENVAHAVRFFIENDFVTGVCLPVDGGRTIYAGGS